MEQLLEYVNKEIERLKNIEWATVNEDGSDVDPEDYDGEDIFSDGKLAGEYSAYMDIKLKIEEQIKRNNDTIHVVNWMELDNAKDMLTGNMNRMCVSDEIEEVNKMRDFAIKRINGIHDYNCRRLSGK